MAEIQVTTLTDENNGTGNLSLREAIAEASSGDTITFSNSGTINLTLGEIGIDKELTIDGDTDDDDETRNITINAQGNSRIFDVNDGANSDFTLVIDGLTLTGGAPTTKGGAIFSYAETLKISNSTITGNSAPEDGGGVYSINGSVDITDSIISSNTAGRFGGGFHSFIGTASILDSTVSGNSAGINGGGVSNSDTTATISNSTISGNSAGSNGGGVGSANSSTATISNSTISGNSAGSNGGGVWSFLSTSTVESTIIAGNSASGSGPDIFGDFTDSGNNLIGDASGNSDFTTSSLVGSSGNPIDPLLGPLQDNGGLTFTQALLAGSPAINTGSNPSELTEDQRGAVRVFSDAIDIGAYEKSLVVTFGDSSISLEEGTDNFIASIDLELSSEVDVEPGIIVNFIIDSGSTATLSEDFYLSQLDISTTDDSDPTDSIFIPIGADSASISIAALPDAIVEEDETFTLTLVPSSDEQATFGEYIIGETESLEVTIEDSSDYTVGLAISDAFNDELSSSEDTAIAIIDGGIWSFQVKLTSEPTNDVTVSLSTSDGNTSNSSLTFTSDNWDTAQSVDVNSLALGTSLDLTTTTSSSDSNYNGLSETLSVVDSEEIVKLLVTESDDASQVQAEPTPDVDISTLQDAIEGQNAPGLFRVTLSSPAPDGGLSIPFTVTSSDGAVISTDYSVIPDVTTSNNIGTGTLTFAAGESTAEIAIVLADDGSVESDLEVNASLVLANDESYRVINGDGTLSLIDNDTAGIETARFTSQANDDGDNVILYTPITSLVTTEGESKDFAVRLSSQPGSSETVTLNLSADSTEGTLSTNTLTFDSSNWNTYQTVTVTGVEDDTVDGNLTYSLDISSSSTDSTSDYARGGEAVALSVTNQDVDSDIEDGIEQSDTLSSEDIIASLVLVDDQTTIREGSNSSVQFEVTLAEAPINDITIPYTTEGGEANNGEDYDLIATEEITIEAGSTTGTINITPIDDDIKENDETVTVSLLENPGITVPLALVSHETIRGSLLGTSDVTVLTLQYNGNEEDFQQFTLPDGTTLSFSDDSGNTFTFTIANESDIKFTTAVGQVAVSGDLVSGTITGDETTIYSQNGYRLNAGLVVTTAFDSAANTIGLQIDETTLDSLTLEEGTDLTFSGGAIATVQTETSISNSGETSVSVTLNDDSTVTEIAADETSSTTDFGISQTTTIIDNDDNGIFGNRTAATVEEAGSIQTFDYILQSQPQDVVTLRFDSPDSTEFLLAAAIPLEVTTSYDSTTGTVGLRIDNDGIFSRRIEAGEILNFDNGVVTQVAEDAILYNSDEGSVVAVSQVVSEIPVGTTTSYNSADADVATLIFTPENWETPQTLTVTGQDDDIEDGTQVLFVDPVVISEDLFYNEDVLVLEVSSVDSDTISLRIDDLSTQKTVIFDGDQLNFSDGTVVTVNDDDNGDYVLRNSEAVPVEIIINEALAAGATATEASITVESDYGVTVDDGAIIVTDDYDADTQTVGLELTDIVLSANLSVGTVLNFGDGTTATVASAATVSSSEETVVSVTNVTNATLAADSVTTDGSIIATSAYNASEGTITLELDDAIQSSFDADTVLTLGNGATLTLTEDTVLRNTNEKTVSATLDTSNVSVTPSATANITEELTFNLVIGVTDDDTAGVNIEANGDALGEGGVINNFYSVGLNSEPTGEVLITLTPADNEIRLDDELDGEPLTLTFDATNWDVPQTVEVTAVDDSDVEYNHSSSIAFSISSDDDSIYNSLDLSDQAVEVFIEDNDLPVASVEVIAGANEANSPGYFVVTLDTPAPAGFDGTGIEVSYTIGGTADAVGTDETPDVQSISGVVRIAPGQTQSPLIAFPIDDFKVEGANLVVNQDVTIAAGSTGTVNLSIDESSFTVDESVTLPSGTELEFGDRILTVTEDETISEGGDTADVSVTLEDGLTDALTLEQDDKTILQGESVVVTLSNSSDNTYAIGDAASSSLLIQDNDKPGVRIVEPSSVTTVTEGSDTGSDFFVSLLSQPEDDVTITLDSDSIANSTTVDLTLISYDSANDSISLQVTDNDVSALTLPAGTTLTFSNGATATLNSEFLVDSVDAGDSEPTITLSASSGTLTTETSADYTFEDITVEFADGTDSDGDGINEELTLTFDSDNWYELQTVTVLGVDDNVAELGDFHTSILSYDVSSNDSNYNGFEVPDQGIRVIDRAFDKGETKEALTEGFLAVQDTLDNLSLPIVGSLSVFTPIEDFLNDVIANVAATEFVTADSLADALNAAISDNLPDVSGLTVEITDLTTDNIAFLVSYSDELTESIALDSDLGLPALGLGIETDGTLEFDLDYGLDFAFGIDTTNGFYIDIANTELSGTASLGLSDDFDAIGELAFLQVEFDNGADSGNQDTGTGVSAELSAGFQNPDDDTATSLSISDLTTLRGDTANIFDFLTYNLRGEADLDFFVTTSFEGNTSFPEITFDLESTFDVFNASDDTKTSTLADSDLGIEFNNITLDAGGFINDVLAPVVTELNNLLDETGIADIVDALTTEIDLIDTLELDDVFGGDTILDVALFLAENFGGSDNQAVYQEFFNAVEVVIEVVDLIEQFNDSGITLELGDYAFDFNVADENNDVSTDVDPDTDSTSNSLVRSGEEQAKQNGGSTNIGEIFGKIEELGISLPLLEDPFTLINLFFGQTVDLINYDVPELDLSFSFEEEFPIFGTIKGVLGGSFEAASDLTVGFDTFGLSEWQAADFDIEDSYLLLDGFYLSDVDESGDDVNELDLDATITAGVDVGAVVASVTAEGGIEGTVGLDVVDEGEYTGESDGKLRVSEILDRIDNPLELFEVNGALEAFLEIIVQVGVDVGIFEVTTTVYDEELASFTIYEFEVGGSSGTVSQGPIEGATVFLDANFNGQLDPGEPSTQSNPDGSYFLDINPFVFDSDGDGVVEDLEGRIIALGGIETSSNQPVNVPFIGSPQGTAITPLTTLKQKLIQLGLDEATAELEIEEVLAIENALDLDSFHVVNALNAEDEQAEAVYLGHVKVTSELNMIVQFLRGSTGVFEEEAYEVAIETAASKLQALTSPEDLESIDAVLAQIAPLIEAALDELGGSQLNPEVQPVALEVLSQFIVEHLQAIEQAAVNRLDTLTAAFPDTAPTLVEATAFLKPVSYDEVPRLLYDLGRGFITPEAAVERLEQINTLLISGQFTGDADDNELVGLDDSNDLLLGQGGNDTLISRSGNDTVAGGLGDDEIFGNSGDDLLRGDLNDRSPGGSVGGDDVISGGDGNDRIGGKGGNDILSGDAGDDQIWGDDGNDTIMGMTGNDTLTGDDFSGGSGSDVFVFGNSDGTDTITDFDPTEDKIGLVEGELTLEDIAIADTDMGATISVIESGETLAVLQGVNADELTSDLFMVTPDVSFN